MTKLTEASLEAMLIKLRKHMDETGEKIALTPTKLIFRPADLKALGLSVNDVTKILKEKNA